MAPSLCFRELDSKAAGFPGGGGKGFAWIGAALILVMFADSPAWGSAAARPPSDSAIAAEVDQAASLGAAWRADQQALTTIRSQLANTSDDARLGRMGAQAAAIQAAAEAAAVTLNQDLAAVEALRKASTARSGHRQTSAERDRIALLDRRAGALSDELHQAQATQAAASVTFSLVAERRREAYNAQVLARAPSPLSPDFWTSLNDAAGGDVQRMVSQASQATQAVVDAAEPRGALSVGLGLALAAIILFPVRRWLERRWGARADGSAAPPAFARTGLALWLVAVDTGLPTLAAIAVRLCARWGGVLSDKADAMAGAGVVAVAWSAAIIALGRALATDLDTHRRLLSVGDQTARRIRESLGAVAVITATGFLLTRLNYEVGASISATIATHCVLALAYAGVAGAILVRLARGRGPDAGREGQAPASPLWALVSLALSAAIGVTIGAVLSGYTTLAALISGQIFWLGVMTAVTYLLLRFVDELCAMLFGQSGWAAASVRTLFNLRPPAINQIGVLASAGLQIVILISALSLALTPFGSSGDELLSHFGHFGHAIQIGSANVSLGSLATGLASLGLGVTVAHLVRGWVVARYLPATDWDSGIRNSVSTGIGYLGVAIAVFCAFAVMGLGLQQIALVASALSVGIGFGLQQIVQNFVSGLILLIERPVKVGDWVSVDGVEGDISRIRVRATEIRAFDRSTIIVPNSDLITKAVQNRTLGDPRGRVQLQFAIAKAADARRAKDLILTVARTKAGILQDPAPAVYIDSVAAGGATTFNCLFYVAHPRDAYRTRSELYFEIIDLFQQKDLAF
jgi:potassium efflux system protein